MPLFGFCEAEVFNRDNTLEQVLFQENWSV